MAKFLVVTFKIYKGVKGFFKSLLGAPKVCGNHNST